MRALSERRADRVDLHPWGVAVVTASLPEVWDTNYLAVDRWPGSAAELTAEADRVHAALGHRHGRVVLHDEELAGRVWADVAWPIRSRYLILAARRAPEPAVDTSAVVELPADEYGRAHLAWMREAGNSTQLARQLTELDGRTAAAVTTHRLGVRAGGQVVAMADLYLEGDVAQVEDVMTFVAHRGRGHASAVVAKAVEVSRAAGAALVFLVTSEADGPVPLYARLGFDPIGVEHIAVRPGTLAA
jgi:GNAT superfamily N-acetyltransferase